MRSGKAAGLEGILEQFSPYPAVELLKSWRTVDW